MNPKPYDWYKLIADIPPDVVFQFVDGDEVLEVKAHRMILAMVSPVFKTMFYTTEVGDKTIKVIKMEETTAAAFQIVIDAIYDTKSIGDSIKGKSVQDAFDVMNLIERYQLTELVDAVQKHFANYAITEDSVLEVAEGAMAIECMSLFKKAAQDLLLTCAKFLKLKLKNAESIFQYAAENNNRKEVFAALLALMSDIAPSGCSNCSLKKCQNGKPVRDDDFRVGLIVTNNTANYSWGRGGVYWGTGKVTKVDNDEVYVTSIKPGRTWKPGRTFSFSGYSYGMEDIDGAKFLFSCK